MNCRDLKELLSAYVDGELAQTQRDFVEEHLATCTECQAVVERYRQTGRQLASLRTPTPPADLRDRVMSRIRTLPGGSRRWLRPALAGASVGILALVLTVVFMAPGRSPQDALAQAIARTATLRAYRYDMTGETRPAATIEWIETGFTQVEYGGPGNLHVKSRNMLRVSSASPQWVNWEWVNSDNTVYLWDLTDSTVSSELMNELWAEQVAEVQDPIGSFEAVAKVKRLPDEMIDGVACRHYQGLVDVDKYVAWQLPILERVERERNERWREVMPSTDNSTYEKDLAQFLKSFEAYLRTRQWQYDYWVGKDDGLLHRLNSVETQASWAHKAMPLSTDHRATTMFYDFNRDIVIKPPLDDRGKLLEGWRIQKP